MRNTKANLTKQKVRTKIKFGEHLVFDAYNCSPKNLNSKKFCIEILEKLVVLAGMHKISEPVLIQADSNETLGGKDPGGISGFVLIQESHISIHTFTKRGFVTLDLYSCKPFVSEGIVEYLSEKLGTADFDVLKIERGLKYPSENIY